MSQAFVKEGDEQWLHDIPGTMAALVNYLTRANNGIRVYEQRSSFDKCSGNTIHEMSNGLSYIKDKEGKWAILL
ncbi:MAG TPA: hypothetical protein VK484_12760 [Ferruginibacter sp.]|nr:hypothetical protein [Ferruginibacter sp.]